MNPKTRNIIAWVITVLLGTMFTMTGVTKLMARPEVVAQFQSWGIPNFLMYIIGVAELLCAIGLFFTKTRTLAISGIVVLMIGAAATHLMNNEFSSVGTNLLLGGAAYGLAYLRRKTD